MSNAAQGVISALCCNGTLLAYVQAGDYQDPQILSCLAAFQLGGPQHLLVHGFIHLQVQDFAVLLFELHEVPDSPFLQSVKVPLDGSTTLCSMSHSSSSGVICKLPEGAASPDC